MRKTLAVLTAFTLLLSCFGGMTVFAATYSGAGKGIAGDPYIITTAEQFAQMSIFTTAEFELRAPEEGLTLKNPVPIKNFKGILRGAEGQNVINLDIDRTGTTVRATVFDSIAGNAVLDNLVLEGTVTGGDTGYTSALVGYIVAGSNAQVTNITNNAKITINCTVAKDLRSGGIIGSVYNNTSSSGNILIENCVNHGEIIYTCDVQQDADFGGVIGEIGAGSDTVTVKNCENHGKISGSKSRLGGVIGKAMGPNATITGCKNFGAITTANAVGGIVGYAQNSAIDNCVNEGKILSSGSSTNGVGGILGKSNTVSTPVSNCVNKGEIRSSGTNVGGIVGTASGNITSCINEGIVFTDEKDDTTEKINIGGITGFTNETEMVVSGCHNKGTVSAVFPVTEAALNTVTYIGGIVGQSRNPSIENCVNEAEGVISGEYPENVNPGGSSYFYEGGIAGYLNNGKKISNCSNYGELRAINPDNKNNARLFCGGIAGFTMGGTIETSSNHGDMNRTARQFGGIIGRFNTSGLISQCFNTGKIESIYSIGYTGGIAARVDHAACVIENCYNVGEMESKENTGGLAGSSTVTVRNSYSIQPEKPAGDVLFGIGKNAVPSNVYFNSFEDARNDGKGTGLSAVQLTDSSAYAGFDFTNVWEIKPAANNTDFPFPQLRANPHTQPYTAMYRVDITKMENGEVSPDGTVYAKGGVPFTIVITPDDGYEVGSLLFNEAEIPGVQSSYTTPALTQNSTIAVTFSERTVIAPQPQGYTAVYIPEDRSGSITFGKVEPGYGYQVLEWGIAYSEDRALLESAPDSCQKLKSETTLSAQNQYGICVLGNIPPEGYYMKAYVVYCTEEAPGEKITVYDDAIVPVI